MTAAAAVQAWDATVWAATLMAWVLGTAAVLGAVGVIVSTLRKFVRWLAHVLIPWVGRAIRLVDTLTALPATVDELRADVTQVQADMAQVRTEQTAHNIVADRKADGIDALARDLAEVRAMVKNNGGTSLLDSAHRLEQALGLPRPTYMPVAAPVVATGPIPIAIPLEDAPA